MDDDDHAPLHIAANEGYNDIVVALLAGGANVNATEKGGRTPLFKASAEGHDQVVQSLLEAGALPNQATSASGSIAACLSASDVARSTRPGTTGSSRS